MTTPSLVEPRVSGVLAAGLTREGVLALSERGDEPQWLRESRLEGWRAFEEMPLPRWTKGIAQWWTTDVSALDLTTLSAYVPANRTAEEARSTVSLEGESEQEGCLLVQINSEVAYLQVPESVKAQGVIFLSLEDAVREHPELVQKYLHKLVAPNKDKFAALHSALWSGGVFLYVPEGVTVEQPVHVVYRLDTPGAVALGHTLIVTERGANVRYIEEFHSDEMHGNQALHSGVIEVVVGEEAKVEFTSMQEWGRNVYSFATRYATVDKGGLMHWVIGEVGAKLIKAHAETQLLGMGAKTLTRGICFPDGDQHYDNTSNTHHAAEDTFGDILFKGALRDVSRLGFEGIIKVDHGAQRTDSYLTMNTLFLSEGARANSIPGLEILADDVKCSHGATVGTVQEQEVFYLMSRGISRIEAEKLIVGGFFEPVIEEMPLESVRQRLRDIVQHKVGLPRLGKAAQMPGRA
ncbi:MAG TPA: Fe-S cluster assembly protein SufD [Chloroflexia bacterium]|nr:Fe-S cluster assembly protein SufD [Chloroflexia bacterium]